MATTLNIPWNDGNGNIVLTYTGQGSGTVTVTSSTDNLGIERSQTLTFKTTGANPVVVQVTVVQPTGMQSLTVRGVYLCDASGKKLRVPPPTN